jgi:DNA polymerase-3 subunit gamma/tau
MHDCIGVTRYAPPELDYTAAPSLLPGFVGRITPALREVTGVAWRVTQSEDAPVATLHEREMRKAADARAEIMETPVVKAALAAFPDAELSDELEQWSAER